MIDTSNPMQVAWLSQVNSELGNLATVNISLSVQLKSALEQVAKLSEDNTAFAQTNRKLNDLVNALREELEGLRSKKK